MRVSKSCHRLAPNKQSKVQLFSVSREMATEDLAGMCASTRHKNPWSCCEMRKTGRLEALVQVLVRHTYTVTHGLLAATDPLARVIVALVRLVLTLRVADLALQVAALRLVEFEEAFPIGPLRVSVHVHLHDAGAHSGLNVRLLGATH